MALHNISGCEAFDPGKEVFGVVSFIRSRKTPWKPLAITVLTALGTVVVIAVLAALGAKGAGL